MQILFDQAARGAPVGSSALPFAVLAALAILYGSLAWWRLAPRRRTSRPAGGRARLVRRCRRRRDPAGTGRPRRHGLDGHGPIPLRRPLSATLCRPIASAPPHRRRRPRTLRAP